MEWQAKGCCAVLVLTTLSVLFFQLSSPANLNAFEEDAKFEEVDMIAFGFGTT